jgi:hypothetical protein
MKFLFLIGTLALASCKKTKETSEVQPGVVGIQVISFDTDGQHSDSSAVYTVHY